MSDEHKGPTAIVEHREPTSMSPVVRLGMEILAQSPSPDGLEKLLAMEREWQAAEARKAYAVARVALKRDLPTVIDRDAAVDFTSAKGRTFYRHASLAGVMDAITEPLTAHGFDLGFRPSTGQNGVSVTCKISHQAGHYEEATIGPVPPDVSGNKNAAQAVASTITYLSRYLALNMLGIATRDMVEPTAAEPPDPDSDATIDSKRNLTAVGWLKGKGKSVAEAALYLGKPIERWTQADRNALRKWAEPPKDEELT